MRIYLKEWRLDGRHRQTQQQLADSSGIAKSTINKIEQGKGAPHQHTIDKLAEAFGVEPQALRRPPHQRIARGSALASAEHEAREQRASFQAQGNQPPSNDVSPPMNFEGWGHDHHWTVPYDWSAAMLGTIRNTGDGDITEFFRRNPTSASFPDQDTRERVVGVLSNDSLTTQQLEALIFVAAVTLFQRAAGAFSERPEDYRGRLASVRRAVDDAELLGRAQSFYDEPAGRVDELEPNAERPEGKRLEQAIKRWWMTHAPEIAQWAGVGPWWDVGAVEGGTAISENGRDYIGQFKRWIDPSTFTGEMHAADLDAIVAEEERA